MANLVKTGFFRRLEALIFLRLSYPQVYPQNALPGNLENTAFRRGCGKPVRRNFFLPRCSTLALFFFVTVEPIRDAYTRSAIGFIHES